MDDRLHCLKQGVLPRHAEWIVAHFIAQLFRSQPELITSWGLSQVKFSEWTVGAAMGVVTVASSDVARPYRDHRRGNADSGRGVS